MKPHVVWYISLPHALKMVKKMGIKKHRDAGYSFELEEVGNQFNVHSGPERLIYANYSYNTVLYKLMIYYEKPNETLTNKDGLPRGGTDQ